MTDPKPTEPTDPYLMNAAQLERHIQDKADKFKTDAEAADRQHRYEMIALRAYLKVKQAQEKGKGAT